MSKYKGDFALYKGEECISIGTLDEIAKEVKMKIESLKFMLTPTYAKRLAKGGNRKVLIAIDDDDEE